MHCRRDWGSAAGLAMAWAAVMQLLAWDWLECCHLCLNLFLGRLVAPEASCTSELLSTVTLLGSVVFWLMGPFVLAKNSVVAYGAAGIVGLSSGWALT